MKRFPLLLLAVFAAGNHIASAVALVTTSYIANTNVGSGTSYFLEGAVGGTTATWSISPGVTVTGGRFFIGSVATPNDATATFVVDGGGTLNIDRTGVFNLRLGQNNASEAGVLKISGGSTVKLTGTTAGCFQEKTGSSIILDGVGSTFTSVGTWNATTGLFSSQTTTTAGVLNSGAIPVTAVGGNISASVNGSFTTLTVLAAAPDPVLTIISPPEIASNGSAVNVSVPFSNTGATLPLTITSVTPGGADAAYFTVNSFTAPVAPGASGSINLTFTPVSGGPYSANLTIASNDSANPSQTINLTGKVSDPAISLASTQVNFGTLAANPGATTVNVPVTNTGANEDLTVTAQLLGSDPSFSITSAPATIAPGATENIVVSFDPGPVTGQFGALLKISTNAYYDSTKTIPVFAQVTSTGTPPIPLAIANGNFNANTYDSAASTAPTGWTNSLTGASGNYGSTLPNRTDISANFRATASGYIQQNLSSANPGLTADKLTSVSVTLDKGYRNDAVTNGPILMRLSLWDLVTNTELSGRDIAIEDTGVQTGTNRNLTTSSTIELPVSSTAANPVALRLATVQPVLPITTDYFATAYFDNITLKAAGTYSPSTPFQDWALASGLDGTAGKENGPNDDPDKDGVPNLQEFAFGANPLSGSSTGLVSVVTADTNSDTQKELLITLAVRTGGAFAGSPSPTATRDGIIYQIQGSADLSSFNATVEGPLAAPVLPSSLPASPPSGYEYLTFRLAGSSGLPSRGFLRASATESP